MKITSFELENVKRVKAVSLAPAESGLTVIGGNNGQGKTSVLDALCWALGGEKYRPSNERREGSTIPPKLHVVMDSGIVVERKGDSGALTVTDPTGRRAGQTLLNEFIEPLALDLPKFLAASDKEKASTLLKVVGVEDQVKALEEKEAQIYQKRRAVGQIADQKRKYAEELPYTEGCPEQIVSAGELIERQQAILLQNAENQKKRALVEQYKTERERLINQIHELTDKLETIKSALAIAETDAQTLQDQSTEALENDIRRVDEINRVIRENQRKTEAIDEADGYAAQYDGLTVELEETRKAKFDLLKDAKLPLQGLGVMDGSLTYNGQKWDCMSGAEQLIVSVSIVRALNPKCGFVLMDKLEQLDKDTLERFDKWLTGEGLQVIATRVSTGSECQIIIVDGMGETPKAAPQWKEGTF